MEQEITSEADASVHGCYNVLKRVRRLRGFENFRSTHQCVETIHQYRSEQRPFSDGLLFQVSSGSHNNGEGILLEKFCVNQMLKFSGDFLDLSVIQVSGKQI